ncbi:histone H3, partial [[Emmonsia] crescens]
KFTELLISKTSFQYFIHEIAMNFKSDLHFQISVIDALQKTAESFLMNEFKMTNLCIIHAKHVIIQSKDMALVWRLHSMITE